MLKKIKIKILILTLIALPIICLHGCGTVKFNGTGKPYVPPAPPATKSKNLALVLGGGGAKGMAHVGVLEELELAGIKPDVIIGCSSGSLVGALYAANPDINSLKALVLPGKKDEVLMLSIRDWPYSVYDTNKLKAYLEKNIPQRNFQDLKIPLIVTATNLEYGNLTHFGEGDLIDPVLASAAMPGAFAPIMIQDQYFIDCGVADPIPVRLARSLGYKTVVAVNIAEKLPDTAPNHVLGLIKRSTEIAYISQCNFSVESADVVIDFDYKNIGIFPDEFNEFLYLEGRRSTKNSIPKILLALSEQSSQK
jgi:NTE family protein